MKCSWCAELRLSARRYVSNALVGRQGANIFCFHVPINWTDEDFHAHFSPSPT